MMKCTKCEEALEYRELYKCEICEERFCEDCLIEDVCIDCFIENVV